MSIFSLIIKKGFCKKCIWQWSCYFLLTWWGHTGCRASSTGSDNTHWPQRRYEEAAPPSGVCCTDRLRSCRTGPLSACRGLQLPGWSQCWSEGSEVADRITRRMRRGNKTEDDSDRQQPLITLCILRIKKGFRISLGMFCFRMRSRIT